VPDGTGGSTAAHPDYSRQQFGGSIGGPFKKTRCLVLRHRTGARKPGLERRDFLRRAGAGQERRLAAQPATSIPRPFYETRYNGRVDWVINAKNTAYASYSSQGTTA